MSEPTPTPRPEDDLAFIRRVMEGAAETASDGSGHLILWGSLQATGEGLSYLARHGVLVVSISLLWAVIVVIGFVGSWLIAQRTHRRAPVTSLVNRVLAAIWIGCGLALSMVGFLGAGTGSVPSLAMPGIKAVIIGSAFFASAVLPNRLTYWLLAAAWWILGGLLLVRPFPEGALVMGCGQILLMVVPGLVLRARRVTPLRLHLVA